MKGPVKCLVECKTPILTAGSFKASSKRSDKRQSINKDKPALMKRAHYSNALER
jgi:hypothetical protein